MIIDFFKAKLLKEESVLNYLKLMENFAQNQYRYTNDSTFENHKLLKQSYASIINYEIYLESKYNRHFDLIINDNVLEKFDYVCKMFKLDNQLNFLIGEILNKKEEDGLKYYQVGINTEKLNGVTLYKNHYENHSFNRVTIDNLVFDIYDLEEELKKEEIATLFY